MTRLGRYAHRHGPNRTAARGDTALLCVWSTRLCEHIVSVGLRCALETKLKVLHDPTNSEALLSAAAPTSLPNSYSRAIC